MKQEMAPEQYEKAEHEPRPVVDFFFTAHLGPRDLEGLRERIESTDIFVPEVFGWNDEVKSYFDDVAKGTMSPEKAVQALVEGGSDERFSEFLFEEFKALHKTNKRIVFLDVPGDHDLVEDFENLPQLATALNNKTVQKRVDIFEKYIRKDAELQKKREQWIEEHLKKESAEIGKEPTFQGRESLKFLMLYGSLHSGLFQDLEREYGNAKRTYRAMPYIFDYVNEAKRRYMFDKAVDEKLLKKGIVQFIAEAFVLPALSIDTKTISSDAGEVHRSIVDLLSEKDIDEVLQQKKLNDAAKLLSSLLYSKS